MKLYASCALLSLVGLALSILYHSEASSVVNGVAFVGNTAAMVFVHRRRRA